MTEVWKPVLGYEGLYDASDQGRIRNARTGRILAQGLNRYGYYHVCVSKGVRLETVAKSLGHSNPRTTARYYAEVSPDTIIKEVTQAFK